MKQIAKECRAIQAIMLPGNIVTPYAEHGLHAIKFRQPFQLVKSSIFRFMRECDMMLYTKHWPVLYTCTNGEYATLERLGLLYDGCLEPGEPLKVSGFYIDPELKELHEKNRKIFAKCIRVIIEHNRRAA